MQFRYGETYTRNHISSKLGGETISYLPQLDGRVVCGCFSPESNPEAPLVILVGGPDNGDVESSKVKKARMLARQTETIPVFLKQAPNAWMYEGAYRANGVIEDRAYLDRKQRRANRSDVVLAILMERAEVKHDTYLLTWNPHGWPWNDLEELIKQMAQGEIVEDHWTCGNTKRIRPGDRLFLMHQGEEPRGITASGWATSATYQGPHWDEARRNQGDHALRVDLRFDRIFNPKIDEILSLDLLRTGPLAAVNWATPASGIQIKHGVDDLERLWASLVSMNAAAQPVVESVGAIEGELRVALSRHHARERWFRDEKIAEVRATHGGCVPCEVCGFDFYVAYGELGKNYAQVHHLKPLGERIKPSLTLLSDLAVVCANCHVMIHRGGEVRPLAELLVGRA